MKDRAIVRCRVSTLEQVKSGSLSRQEANVKRVAAELGIEVIETPNAGWWSGDISSKAGTNVKRKDLKEMLAFCQNHKRVKYLIVDEPDRFMRSIDEAFHFEVEFRLIGVTLWYTDPELNTGDLMAKFRKFLKYWEAESSNEERQRKSVSGHTYAIAEGRFTFHPPVGYMPDPRPKRSKLNPNGIPGGIHVRDPLTFEPFQRALRLMAHGINTPGEALRWLNSSEFAKHRGPMKIDKFMKHASNPYYCGVVQVNKQVVARNPNGLHEPMISQEEHEAILYTKHLNLRRRMRAQPA